jgi:cytoskeletal protein CcmA (bactofilin family)
MLWEKKPPASEPKKSEPEWTPPPPAPKMETPMTDNMPKFPSSTSSSQGTTLLGRTAVMHGEISASEDLQIEGQFDGTINLAENILTVGPKGQVKAEIHARQVVVHGSVNGNVTAREKIEIRKTGHVLGDLVAAGVAIEDGAYFKGSIEILREGDKAASSASRSASPSVSTSSVSAASTKV